MYVQKKYEKQKLCLNKTPQKGVSEYVSSLELVCFGFRKRKIRLKYGLRKRKIRLK